MIWDRPVTFATHERIRAVLNGNEYAPARKDINKDFPLRGFVLCDDCGEAMTSCWSKGRKKLYAYYLCDTPSCDSKRKSIPRAEIEEGAEDILRAVQPARQLIALARAMFSDVWDMRLAAAHSAKSTLDEQIKDIESQIEALLDRIVSAANGSVIQAYETRIEKRERQKIMLAEQAEQTVPPQGRFEEFIEHAMEFLASPCNIYEKGSIALKRTVLKLAFAEPLRYKRNEGYRTAKTTFPFKVLVDFSTPKCGMVVVTVCVEPVSARIPCFTGNLQGNLVILAGYWPNLAIYVVISSVITVCYEPFPCYLMNRETALPDQGMRGVYQGTKCREQR